MSGTTRFSNLEHRRVREFAAARAGEHAVELAPAKVNVRLKVVGRRDDGYHRLSMLNLSCSLADEVELRFTLAPEVSLRIDPSGSVEGPAERNLAMRAFCAFWSAFDVQELPLGCELLVRKRIPVGAGLGGGSSDAAAVIRVLSRAFRTFLQAELGLSDDSFDHSIVQACLACGADVPYAYAGGVCWVGGIGEEVVPLPPAAEWPGEVLILVPPVAVPTHSFYELFRRRRPHVPECADAPMRAFVESPHGDLPALVDNDFTPVIVEMAPLVGEILSEVRAVFPEGAGITGSGSALFALVGPSDLARARHLAERLTQRGVAVHRTSLVRPQAPAD